MTSIEDLLDSPPESFRERLARDLAGVGYSVFPGLLREELAAEVRREMEDIRRAGEFRPAGVGKDVRFSPETRGDGTHWLEPGAPTAVQAKLGRFLSRVREDLNRDLFLGLWDWEGHYAVYPPGAFYRRHLDRFASDSKRTVSVVLFFNAGWAESDGGALRIEGADGTRDVFPAAGTAVFFMSDRVPHEVRETKRERFSFAGWFRTRA